MDAANEPFMMFSTSHMMAMLVIGILLIALKFSSYRIRDRFLRKNTIEKTFALSLLMIEWLYYIWMALGGHWDVRHSLPFELCSISLYAAIIFLLTNQRHFYPFVFFAGIGGAIQAIVTPDLEFGFPHFRFFHFFYTHAGIILTAFYFTWMKGNRPSFKNLMQTMALLNVVAVVVYLMNRIVDGNYMFLRMKPENGSLLDYLGPSPWYIGSLEFIAFGTFLLLWLLFKEKR